MSTEGLTRQERINYDVALRKGMTPTEARAHALHLTVLTNRSVSNAATVRLTSKKK
jgi:hypothetical protein